MGCKKSPGLRKRKNGIWHIEKQYLGTKICESTGESDLEEAEKILTHRLEQIRIAKTYGERPNWTFRDAATKFLNENHHLKSLCNYVGSLTILDPYIGNLELTRVHQATLQSFIDDRKKQGVKNKTINLDLSAVRRILNLAARLWRDENGLTWLQTSPLIVMLDTDDARTPYPLSIEEQRLLFKTLPDHLSEMALFKVNTGTREIEVCSLKWEWEIDLPDLKTSVFLIPKEYVKNKEDRLVVLNATARSIIKSVRGTHSEFVFTLKGKPITSINNTAWQRGRIRAALELVKKDPTCKSVETKLVRDKGIILYAELTCHHTDYDEPIVLQYSMDEHDKARMKKGYISLTLSQRKDRGVGQIIRYKLIRQFIDEYWPVYSNFARVRVHDLKHTFGRRLRAASVPLETRKVLLGHTNGDITTHYSGGEVKEIIDGANKVCSKKSGKSPALIVLRRKSG